ncbi:MAG: hypothetical protein AAFV62_05275, partial [Pseudomonadota bacterium]
DLQGRYEEWDREPGVWHRQGKILDDGRMQVPLPGPALATFWLQEGLMHGVYDWGKANIRVKLAPNRPMIGKRIARAVKPGRRPADVPVLTGKAATVVASARTVVSAPKPGGLLLAYDLANAPTRRPAQP